MNRLYSNIDRKIFFPLSELFFGSAILKEFKKLSNSDWQSKEILFAVQKEKLSKLVNHCYRNVPYYTQLFDSLSINPGDIKNMEDLSKIPILTKQIIRDNYDKLISTDIASRKTKNHSTGGSTGVPLQFQTDIQTWNIAWASTLRAWNWYGLNLGEKIFTIGGHSLVSDKKLFSKKDIFEKYLIRNYKNSSSEMTEADMQNHYRRFMKIKPVALRGYASTLYVFAKFIQENKLPIHSLRLILTTGEVLISGYRNKLQDVFHCPVFDSYGAGDGGISSHECYMHEGLHITEERCIVEICDTDGNNIEDGQVGNVITTDLYNYAFPFLRYSVGDMSYIKKDLCSCGRKSRLFGEVLGRNGKLLYSKTGVPISPTMLPVLLYPDMDYNKIENQALYNKIDRFQIQQNEDGDLIILLKMRSKDEESLKMFNYVIANFTRTFPGSIVTLKIVNQIDKLSSGKEDYVISKFNSNKYDKTK